MKKALIIGGILIGVGALAWYIKRQANLLKDFCFNFVGYKIINLNRDRITIELKLDIKNKSDIDVTINGYNFDIFMNGAYVSKVLSKKVQKIAKHGFSILNLTVDIEPKKNKSLANWDFLSRVLLDVNNIKVKIKGDLSATALGINAKNVPVDLEMKLKEMLPDSKNPSPPCK